MDGPHGRHQRRHGNGPAVPVGVVTAIGAHRIRHDARRRPVRWALRSGLLRLQARDGRDEGSMTLGPGVRLLALGFGLALSVLAPVTAHAQETIAEIRVHGNHTTPDADVIGLSGLKPGDAATDARLAEAEQTLRKSNRFDDVELRKRFRSIDNPADILIMIVIDERSGVSTDDLTPGFGARVRTSMLWWPILNYADGYGFTYGLRPAFADPIGMDSVLSFPLSWGGERRAGAELEKSFNNQRTRAGVAFSVSRRVNPFFEVSDLRQQVRLEADHAVVPWMRVGAGASIANVDFG